MVQLWKEWVQLVGTDIWRRKGLSEHWAALKFLNALVTLEPGSEDAPYLST